MKSEIDVVQGYRCASGLRTILDLAETMDDITWEHAFEAGLRKELFTVDQVSRSAGERIQRVLALRPPGTPPTESLLETLAVQLIRSLGLPDPVRQYVVYDEQGNLVARVDLAWPDLGLFIELDGRQHLGQGDYDARRETAVVAATGWLCGRFTWREVHDLPTSTGRRLVQLFATTRRRLRTDVGAAAQRPSSRP